MLSELEEILVYKKLQQAAEVEDSAELRNDAANYLTHLTRMWTKRLRGCQRSVDVWLRILSVRSLVLTPKEDLFTYIEFARICRKSASKSQLSGKILTALGWRCPPQLMMAGLNNNGDNPTKNVEIPVRNTGDAAAAMIRPVSGVADLVRGGLGNTMNMNMNINMNQQNNNHHQNQSNQNASYNAFDMHLNSSNNRHRTTASSLAPPCHPRVAFAGLEDMWHMNRSTVLRERILTSLTHLVKDHPYVSENADLLVRCQMRIGHWTNRLYDIETRLDENIMSTILNAFEIATKLDPMYFKAWHAWALMNFRVVKIYERLCGGSEMAIRDIKRLGLGGVVPSSETKTTATASISPIGTQQHHHNSSTNSPPPAARVASHLVPAIQSFFHSVSVTLQQRKQRHKLVSNVLQDMLRLITLWFDYGALPEVNHAMEEGFKILSVDTWLYVIPQLIARIHTEDAHIQALLHQLLCDIGRQHPQALIYPLTVASHSDHANREQAAKAVLFKMREHSAVLVDQAALVSSELIRVAILWHEMWHEGLEEASRLYFGQHDVEGMMQVIEPLYRTMRKGPETLREVSFHQAFWREIDEAYQHLMRFKQYGKEADINQAWDLFYHVFRRINKQLPQVRALLFFLSFSFFWGIHATTVFSL